MYEVLAEHYEEIFPVGQRQVDFIAERAVGPGGDDEGPRDQPRVLDVGCATGDLSAALAGRGFEVNGIDLDPAMVERARRCHLAEREDERLRFYEMNMLSIAEHFPEGSFDALLCLGNTLVHLSGPDEISSFFRSAAGLLKPGGRMLLQILNYDRLLERRPQELPPIETEGIRFERRYTYPEVGAEERGITFTTTLTLKTARGNGGKRSAGEDERHNDCLQHSDQVQHSDRMRHNVRHSDSVRLYPLRRGELERLLEKAGFGRPALYGSFDGKALEPEDFPLIALAREGTSSSRGFP